MELPECPVCLQSFDETETVPLVLPCGHSTCQTCVKLLPLYFSHTIRCPACNQLVRIPSSNSSLPKNIDLLRYINQHESESKSKQVTNSGKLKKDINKRIEFPIRTWSDGLYSQWNDWILPSDFVQDKKVGSLGLCFGRITDNIDSSCLSSSNRDWLCKNGDLVSLFCVCHSSLNDESLFNFSYVGRIMDALAQLDEKERTQLRFLIQASMRGSRICIVYGLWMDSSEGSIFLVCEQKSLSFSNILNDFSKNCDSLSEEREREDLLHDLISSTAFIGVELCEAVMCLHSQGLICGCLGPSCFQFDNHGRLFVSFSDLLVASDKLSKIMIKDGSNMSNTSFEGISSLYDEQNLELFVSPELLVSLPVIGNVDQNSDKGFGYCLDVWSLGCILLKILLGGSCYENIFKDFYCFKFADSKESHTKLYEIYEAWIKKVVSRTESLLRSEFEGMQRIIYQCLNYYPANRPSVHDVWKCLRGFIVNPLLDILVANASNQVNPVNFFIPSILLSRSETVHKRLIGSIQDSLIKNKHVLDDSCDCTLERNHDLNYEDYDRVSNEKLDGNVIQGLIKGKMRCMTLKGHHDCITGLAAGGGFLVSSSFDKTVHAWSLKDFSHKSCFRGHQHRVMAAVVVDQPEPLCISGDSGGLIFVWYIDSSVEPEPLKKWNEHTDWRYSGVHSLAVSGSEYLYSGSGDKSIKAWSLQDFTLKCTMTGHKSVVSSLEVSDAILYSGSWDGTVRLWLLIDHSPLAILEDAIPENVSPILSISAENEIVIAAHENGDVKIWKNDILIKSIRSEDGAILSLDIDEKQFFMGGWNKKINVQEVSEKDSLTHIQPVGTIACDSIVTALLCFEGKLFVGFSDNVIKVYYYPCC